MNIEEKEHLALTRDMSVRAAAIRIMAARLAVGFNQEQLARDMDDGMTKQKISNTERGDNYPSHLHLRYFHRQHRIDFTFLMHGDFSHLHSDVQAKLFPALEAAHNAWDQRSSLNSGRKKPTAAQPRSES